LTPALEEPQGGVFYLADQPFSQAQKSAGVETAGALGSVVFD
jgi:hypothetical protein